MKNKIKQLIESIINEDESLSKELIHDIFKSKMQDKIVSESFDKHTAVAILPLGKTDLSTGVCKYFNIYETWDEDNKYELYKLDDSSYVIIAGSSTNKIGTREVFMHDQTNKFLFNGVLEDFTLGSKLKEWVTKYSMKSCRMFIYK